MASKPQKEEPSVSGETLVSADTVIREVAAILPEEVHRAVESAMAPIREQIAALSQADPGTATDSGEPSPVDVLAAKIAEQDEAIGRVAESVNKVAQMLASAGPPTRLEGEKTVPVLTAASKRIDYDPNDPDWYYQLACHQPVQLGVPSDLDVVMAGDEARARKGLAPLNWEIVHRVDNLHTLIRCRRHLMETWEEEGHERARKNRLGVVQHKSEPRSTAKVSTSAPTLQELSMGVAGPLLEEQRSGPGGAPASPIEEMEYQAEQEMTASMEGLNKAIGSK